MGGTIELSRTVDAVDLVKEEVGFDDEEYTNIKYLRGRTVEVTAADGGVWKRREWRSIDDSPWYVSGVVERGVELTRE